MAAHQAPPSLGFSRQEHWRGLPFPSPMHESEKWKWSRSVMSDPQRPHGLQPTRLLCPWDFSRQEYWSGVPLPSPMVYYLAIKRNETGSFVETWMDLESVIQSKVCQKKKQMLYITHTWNLEKCIDDLIYKTENRDRHRERMCRYQTGKGWSRHNWKIGIDTYTLLTLWIK